MHVSLEVFLHLHCDITRVWYLTTPVYQIQTHFPLHCLPTGKGSLNRCHTCSRSDCGPDFSLLPSHTVLRLILGCLERLELPFTFQEIIKDLVKSPEITPNHWKSQLSLWVLNPFLDQVLGAPLIDVQSKKVTAHKGDDSGGVGGAGEASEVQCSPPSSIFQVICPLQLPSSGTRWLQVTRQVLKTRRRPVTTDQKGKGRRAKGRRC